MILPSLTFCGRWKVITNLYRTLRESRYSWLPAAVDGLRFRGFAANCQNSSNWWRRRRWYGQAGLRMTADEHHALESFLSTGETGRPDDTDRDHRSLHRFTATKNVRGTSSSFWILTIVSLRFVAITSAVHIPPNGCTLILEMRYPLLGSQNLPAVLRQDLDPPLPSPEDCPMILLKSSMSCPM